jgi:DNA helicase II / ATP-dependent DNA helicase PcrA
MTHDIPILTAPSAPSAKTDQTDQTASGVAEYKGEYQVIGPPGTGKTTFIKHQVEKIMRHYHGDAARRQITPNPILVCSLTKTAAHEAASRVLGGDLSPGKQFVGTLHAHAFRVLGMPSVATGPALTEFNKQHPGYALDLGPGSTDDATDLMPSGSNDAPGQPLLETYDITRHQLGDVSTLPKRVQHFAEVYEKYKEENGLLDFTDMIARAVDAGTEGLGPTPPKVLLVDEAQDMSALEFDLCRTWGHACGAMIAVGDAWQALYTWRGADPSQLMSSRVTPDRRRVLGQSYRVPEAVVEASQNWVSATLSDYEPIEYKPREGDAGTVDRIPVSLSMTDSVVRVVSGIEAGGGTVMLQATCSYMLVPIVKALRSAGIPFANPWRRRQGAWNPLHTSTGRSYASKLAGFFAGSRAVYGAYAGAPTWRAVDGWVSSVNASAFTKRGVKAAVRDRADDTPDAPVQDAEWERVFGPQAYELLSMMDPPDTAACMDGVRFLTRSRMEKYKSGATYITSVCRARGVRGLVDEPRVFVGTVHSFKGGEADTVILMPDLSPKAYGPYSRGGPDADPVSRTMYVGMTRAKQRLLLGSASTSHAVDWGVAI